MVFGKSGIVPDISRENENPSVRMENDISDIGNLVYIGRKRLCFNVMTYTPQPFSVILVLALKYSEMIAVTHHL